MIVFIALGIYHHHISEIPMSKTPTNESTEPVTPVVILLIVLGLQGDDVQVDLSSTNSKLAPPIQDLVRMIFDIESMKKAMKEFEVCEVLVFVVFTVRFMFS